MPTRNVWNYLSLVSKRVAHAPSKLLKECVLFVGELRVAWSNNSFPKWVKSVRKWHFDPDPDVEPWDSYGPLRPGERKWAAWFTWPLVFLCILLLFVVYLVVLLPLHVLFGRVIAGAKAGGLQRTSSRSKQARLAWLEQVKKREYEELNRPPAYPMSVSRFTNLGIDARVLAQSPFMSGPLGHQWVEISGSPIRWIEFYYGTTLFVPDPRIGRNARIKNDFPFVELSEEPWDREFQSEVPWQLIYGGLRQRDRDLKTHVADHLANLEADHLGVGEMGGLAIWVRPPGAVEGCWCLEWDDWEPEWSRPLWDRLEALAELLLAIPVPTDA